MKKRVTIILVLFALIALGTYMFGDELDEIYRENVLQRDTDLDISHSVSDFGFHLFSSIEQDGNIVISPYSVHMALLIAYNGAEGITEEEMREALFLPEGSLKEINEKSLTTLQALDQAGLRIANALYLKEEYPFLDIYKQRVKENFYAEASPLPSTGEPINEWIKEKTEGNIEDVIGSGEIPPDVVSYIVNAIYFKEAWEKEFNKENTRERSFYIGDEDLRVETMTIRDDFEYMENSDMQAITLPYAEGGFVMHVVLPQEEFPYEDFSLEKFREKKDDMSKEEVSLYLPRFEVDYDQELSSLLQDLGMTRAFNETAEFGRMVDLSVSEGVYISRVLHNAFLEVAEEGTEAAAATVVEMVPLSANGGPTDTSKTMRVDRPFFFIIEKDDMPLFMGYIENPEE